jgi:hypothetical protein
MKGKCPPEGLENSGVLMNSMLLGPWMELSDAFIHLTLLKPSVCQALSRCWGCFEEEDKFGLFLQDRQSGPRGDNEQIHKQVT